MNTEAMGQIDVDKLLARLKTAENDGHITADAVGYITQWLTQPRYAEYAPEVARHIDDEKWQILDDVFWTIIPFGTGGRRGRMYPIGSNSINDRTIGESARGLAEYVLDHLQDAAAAPSCAIAFDTRHNSLHFAKLCAEIMVAAGFHVYFLDEPRSTPELSFLVRYRSCSCGIMVTASHNPPSDNAVKCYWSTGGQLVPPHDQGVIHRVMGVEGIPRVDFERAVSDGVIQMCRDEVGKAYCGAVSVQGFAGPRDVKIIFSPLHGVGASAVVPALAADGFEDVEVFGPHADPDGDFPNVPDHVSNPENPRVFDAMIQRAQKISADVILATDPDCDRLGCAAPKTSDPAGEWGTFTGNQIGALLTDYVLEKRQASGQLSADHYLVKTLVTTEMVRRIGDSYGVTTHGNLLVGFKWIGQAMDEFGPGKFILGTEESHGYLVGQYARDKDGAVAAMLMSEVAAAVKADGQTLHEKMEALYWQHGYHAERLINLQMAGSEGMARMQGLMSKFRSDPPGEIGGLRVAQVRDYSTAEIRSLTGEVTTLDGPNGNMIVFDLDEKENYVAARPSGTEPKVKFYMFTFVPAEQLSDLDLAADEMNQRLDQMAIDLEAFAETVQAS